MPMSSSSIILDFFPACFYCGNNFNFPHKASGSDGKNIVFEIPEAEIFKLGGLIYFIGGLFLVDLLLVVFTSNFISFAKSYINFLSDKLARSTI